ncbi:MAG: sulfatase-like hydrolase/transferase [candidate division FCPU426 bacterium]
MALLKKILSFILRYAAYAAAGFLLVSGFWLKKKFGTPSFEQVLYHLQFGSEGLADADADLIHSFVKFCLKLPLAAALLPMALEPLLGLRRRPLPWLALALGALVLLHHLSFYEHVRQSFGKDYFAAHYVDPRSVAVKAVRPRNLVLIYVESLETGYSDPKLFGHDLLKSLDARSLGGVSFGRFLQAPGTGWTMGGIVGTQCGVPLRPQSIFRSINDEGEKAPAFLPGAMALGDVLRAQGYRNIFLEGASLSFAGKKKFLESHGYDRLLGRDEWVALGEDPKAMGDWGLHDDDLFRRARQEIDAQEKAGGLFNLTLLTLDMHPPGYLCKTCARKGQSSFEGIVECSAEQVAGFVSYIRAKGYLKNTVVVVMGDHLSMINPVYAKLQSLPERHVFNLFIADPIPKKNREDIVHFDLLPSLLEFSGLDLAGHRMGLGVSAFAEGIRLPDAGERAEMNREIMAHSARYMGFWKAPH